MAKCAQSQLIVFAHGLNGTGRDFDNLIRHVSEAFGENLPNVRLHAANCNASVFGTYDGVVAAGLRLASEISMVAAEMPALEEVSVVGHSLGGIYLR